MPINPYPIPAAPSKKRPVRELVEEAGVNVDDWAFTKDGDVIENPNDNISRNTNWSFVGKAGEPIVLCIRPKTRIFSACSTRLIQQSAKRC